MLTLAEIVRSSYGAWRLAHADPGGMSFFDKTLEGFWRSFRVAVLVGPAYALLVLSNYLAPSSDPDAPPLAAGFSRIAMVEAIAYAIIWIAYPLAAHYLAMALDREREYVGYIVAYNWSSVVQLALLLPIDAIVTWELLPLPLSVPLWIAMVLAVLTYSWFIAKTALKIGGLPAAGMVAMSVLLEYLVLSIKNTMIY